MLTTFLIMASATFYTGGLDARGVPLSRDVARYGSVCACNRYPLGTRLLASRAGHRATYLVIDRIGAHSDFDVYSLRAFRLLAGRDGARVGRVSVSLRVVGHVNVLGHPSRRVGRGRRGRR